MTINLRRALALPLIFAGAVSLAGVVSVRADSPGALFLDLDEGGAAVVHPPQAQAKARLAKPEVIPPDEIVAAIKEGAQPADTSLIVVYHGQLYIVPDKALGQKMASEMVMHPKQQ